MTSTEAVHHVWNEISQKLRDASDAQATFRELGFCEQVLESDLREWMRLMVCFFVVHGSKGTRNLEVQRKEATV